MLTPAACVGGRPHSARGFTLVELMITVTVMTLLILAAAPSLRTWIFNTRIRTAAEALQNGLRLAQSEAVRQSRQVVFALTDSPPQLNVTTAANGRNWSIQTVPNVVEGAGNGRFVRGGPMADTTGGVTITNGPQSLCFSSLGVQVTNPAPAPVATGAACTAGDATYIVNHTSGDRPLRVLVSLSGRVRMCDPNRPTGTPDGC